METYDELLLNQELNDMDFSAEEEETESLWFTGLSQAFQDTDSALILLGGDV
eukprot:CAMPEP_0117754942 /NCGR_PEP_ID=MMETSP0947-20121206/13149_1 /TAXON_ID=44440 /ORGANISM="Chattonella subsalsa, Strain CCMP2191" /LENGTH=51 /DNA_ID=CAMNT_0005574167 /DNA_START=331 /DNA_END=486 /DNA_ORIENTATION=-